MSKVFWVTKFNLPKKERTEMKPKPENSKLKSMRTHKVKKEPTPVFSDISTIHDISISTISE